MDKLPVVSSSGFRSRDQSSGNSTDSSGTDERSSDSGFSDEKVPESMAGKGIRHLCSELLELKKASNEDFITNVYSHYSTFVRVFKDVGGLENEIMELKLHVSTQRKLVQDLISGIYLQVLSADSIESLIGESVDSKQYPVNKLEIHTATILEKIDILLTEHRLEEALVILETDYMTLQRIQSEEDIPVQTLISYDYATSERRTRLAEQFAQVAEHPRVSAPEFQEALSGLCRLGDSHHANVLLLKFYHLRLANGMSDLQRAKPILYGTYIRKLAKLVFSVISQAARSFVVLHGEASPYTSELIQWAQEETEVFVDCFDKYVKSLSETIGGLSLAVEAVQDAISFCSLLESQRVLLQPYLIRLIRPCMEQVVEMHIDHFKKVIGIFAGNDIWVLGTFFLLGSLKEGHSPMGTTKEFDYCLITSSARKLVTVMQALIEYASPLVILQMGSSILKGLADLFCEYINILESAIPINGNAVVKGGRQINPAKTMSQQLSLLANSSFLVTHLFSSVAEVIFRGTGNQDKEPLMENSQQRELADFMSTIQEAAGRLKEVFCQRFVSRIMSLGEGWPTLNTATYVDCQGEAELGQDLVPSVAFQGLFVELMRLERLAKDVFIGVDGVVELQRQLLENFLSCFSSYQEFWTTIEESSPILNYRGFEQFILDMQFLVEISRFGGYFSDNLLDTISVLVDRMGKAFFADESDPESGVLDDGWAITAANSTISKLLETAGTEIPVYEGPKSDLEENYDEVKNGYTSNSSDDHTGKSFSNNSVDSGDEMFECANIADTTEIVEIAKLELPILQNPKIIHEEDYGEQSGGANNSLHSAADKQHTRDSSESIKEDSGRGTEDSELQNSFFIGKESDTRQSGDSTDSVEENSDGSSVDNNSVKLEDGWAGNVTITASERLEELDRTESQSEFDLEEDFDKQQIGDSGDSFDEDSNRSSIDNSVNVEDGQAGNVSKTVIARLQEIGTTEVPSIGGPRFSPEKDSDKHQSDDLSDHAEESSDRSSVDNMEKSGVRSAENAAVTAI